MSQILDNLNPPRRLGHPAISFQFFNYLEREGWDPVIIDNLHKTVEKWGGYSKDSFPYDLLLILGATFAIITKAPDQLWLVQDRFLGEFKQAGSDFLNKFTPKVDAVVAAAESMKDSAAVMITIPKEVRKIVEPLLQRITSLENRLSAYEENPDKQSVPNEENKAEVTGESEAEAEEASIVLEDKPKPLGMFLAKTSAFIVTKPLKVLGGFVTLVAVLVVLLVLLGLYLFAWPHFAGGHDATDGKPQSAAISTPTPQDKSAKPSIEASSFFGTCQSASSFLSFFDNNSAYQELLEQCLGPYTGFNYFRQGTWQLQDRFLTVKLQTVEIDGKTPEGIDRLGNAIASRSLIIYPVREQAKNRLWVPEYIKVFSKPVVEKFEVVAQDESQLVLKDSSGDYFTFRKTPSDSPSRPIKAVRLHPTADLAPGVKIEELQEQIENRKLSTDAAWLTLYHSWDQAQK